MQSTFNNLNAKDKALLVELYEMEHYKALKKMLILERANIAEKCLITPKEGVEHLQGQASALHQLNLAMQHLYKQEVKKD